MKSCLLLLALLPAAALIPGPQHYELQAAYVPPARPGADGSVSVTFVPKNPDVHVNETPPPRLKLDPAQTVLVDKQAPPPSKVEPFDPEKARYLDPALPVSFPVALAKGAPKGAQTVSATVTYFYCSKREGWCRKGSSDVSFTVDVR